MDINASRIFFTAPVPGWFAQGTYVDWVVYGLMVNW